MTDEAGVEIMKLQGHKDFVDGFCKTMKGMPSKNRDFLIASSVGADLEEVSRFRAHPFADTSFWNVMFTKEERAYLRKYRDPFPHAAGMFSAKEAVRKSLFYFKEALSFRDVRIDHAPDGRPLAELSGIAHIVCQVSIAHTVNTALAVAVCQKYGSGTHTRGH